MNFSRISQFLLLSTVLLVVFMFAGCSDEDDPIVDPVPSGAKSGDELVSLFVASYDGMLIDEFEEILHDDFQLILESWVIDDWGLEPEATLDKSQMLLCHQNMFGGIGGYTHNGWVVNPLAKIEVSVFERRSEWASAPVDDLHFSGCKMAIFQIDFWLTTSPPSYPMAVQHDLVIYTSKVGNYYYLKGIRERGEYLGKGYEVIPYDRFVYQYGDNQVKPHD